MASPRVWLLATLCRLTMEAPISERSCEDLLSIVGNWSVYGSPFVCGASRIGNCEPPTICCPDPRGQTWAQAKDLCARSGMRLCTRAELTADEAKGTGCGVDIANVWSSDECSPTHATSQCGSSDCLDSFAPACTLKTTLQQTRCCADASSACRTYPCGAANLCNPSSATTYTCRCYSPHLPTPGLQSCTTPPVCGRNECSVDQESLNKCLDLRNGTYTCACAPGWTVESGGQACVSPPDPCLRNPCQRNAVNRNVCNSLSNGTYRCSCNNGWLLTRSSERQDTCVEVPTICRNNTSCNHDLEPMNMCVDMRDGAFACECRGAHWKPSRNRLSCIKRHCLTDPCDSFQDPENVCRENGDTYNCTCNSRFWTHAVGRERCVPIRDPCDDDPCNVQDSEGRNRCINNYNGSYACSCNAFRFRASMRQDMPVCMYLPDMCIANNYPCNELRDNGNKCEDQMDGKTYKCVCRGRGWNPGPNNQSCIPLANACANHPCGENVTGANTCNDKRDGTYTCTCNTRGWRLSLDDDGLQICIPPGNPCLVNDPCRSVQAGNMCTNRYDSTYYCVCGARGWLTPFGAQSCIPPMTSEPTIARQTFNQCTRGDPCSRVSTPGNACIDLSNVPSSPFSYRCECHTARGWTQGPNNTRCIAPLNRCREQTDFCNNTANPLNRCVDLHDGTYECSCQGLAWRTGPAKQSCLPPINMCKVVNDFCKVVSNPDNICIDLGAATYRCVCNARGFIATSNNQFCKEPSNPCSSKPCGEMNANVCTPGVGDTYTCNCRAIGWTTAVGNKRCLPPPNPCLYRDPCKTFQNRYNRCEDNRDGTYSCTCSGRGWTAALPNSQSCVPPDNACRPVNRTRFDPCLALVHPRNYCVDNEDGTYKCVCKAPLYTTGLAEQSCICPNPCAVSDPCLTSEENANSCYIKFNNTVQLSSPMSCYWHGCICGNGWRLFIDSAQNERCVPPDPCLTDRCSSKADPLNECVNVYQPPAAIFEVVDSQNIDYPVFNPQRADFPVLSTPIGLPGPSINSFNQPFPNFGFSREDLTSDTPEIATSTTSKLNPPTRQGISLLTTNLDAKVSAQRPGGLASAPVASRSSVLSSAPATSQEPSLSITDIAQRPATSPRNSPAALPSFASGSLRSSPTPALSTLSRSALLPTSSSTSALTPTQKQSPAESPKDVERPTSEARRAGPPIVLLPPPGRRTLAGRRTLGVLQPRSGPQVTPGSYVCKCNAVGWTTPVGARYCEMPNPCELEDPCSSRFDPDNICYTGKADGSSVPSTPKLGTFVQDYYCDCNGRGWYTPTGAQWCERCTNPCWSNGDACASLVEEENICSWDFEGFFEAADALLQPVFNAYIAPGVPADAVFASQFIGVNSPNPWVANYFTRSDGNPYNDYWTPFLSQGPNSPAGAAREGGVRDWLDEERNISKTDVRKKPRDVKFDIPLRRQNPFVFVPHTSQTLGPRNVPAGACGSYTCLCNGESWRAPVTGKYCALCPNPCFDDPCNHEFDDKNVCEYRSGPDVSPPNTLNPDNVLLEPEETISNPFTGRRLMQASASLWPQDYLTQGWNGATSDAFLRPFPTSAQFDPSYRDPSVCGKNQCQCDGVGWQVSIGGDRCELCPDPCSNDPCQSFYDSDNVCFSSFNTPGFYTAYFGTDAGFDLQELLSTLTPAIGTGNKDCMAYVCVCGGENFAAGPLRQTCVRCVDPCTNLLDPCQTSRSPNNFCINVNKGVAVDAGVSSNRRLLQTPSVTSPQLLTPRRRPSTEAPTAKGKRSSVAPTYSVVKRESGQQTANTSSGRRALEPNDPASRSVLDDLLQGALNSRLQDILTSSFGTPQFTTPQLNNPSYSQAIDPNTGQAVTQFCGKNSCACDGVTWQLSPDSQRCEPICSNRCALADPCSSVIEPNNRCTFTPSTKSNTCGYYICSCYTGWRPTFGQQGCMQIPQNACQRAGQDPCSGLVNGQDTGNLCILDVSLAAGYRCSCAAPNWQLSQNTCVLAPGGVTPRMIQRARNRLNNKAGDAADYNYDTSAPTEGPSNPCDGHDNCMVYLHPGNTCVRSGPSSYQCKCNQPGFSASATFSRCVPR